MSLEARCGEAAKRLAGTDFVRIVSDDDADGIAAAGVMTRALDRASVPFHLTLDRLHVDEYAGLEAHDAVLLLDQGAGELDRLATHPGQVTILDHHQVEGRAPHALHVNPNEEGVDGTTECCTSTLAMLVALEMGPDNVDLAPVAMAGIVGDRQHVPSVQATNASLVDHLVGENALQAKSWPPLDPDRALAEQLAESVDPFLLDVSGDPNQAQAFVEALGLNPTTPPSMLAADDMRRLTSAIVAHLSAQSAEARACERVAGTRYTGKVAGRAVNAGTLAGMFNACEREDEASLGVAIAHESTSAFDQAHEHASAYDESLLEGLLELVDDPPTPMTAIQVFDAVDPDLVGAHCGLGMTYVFDPSKPTLGLKRSDGNLKISSRATKGLVDAGVDLSIAMSEAADAVDGNGGGHPIAAGAMIPAENREAFLDHVDDIVGDQLGR